MSMMLPQEMLTKTRMSLLRHEGCRKFPYFDTSVPPKITIGIGYNLTDRGLDMEWINNQFNDDVDYFYSLLCTFDWFSKLNEDRQIILIDMCFMGWKKFLGFKSMLLALDKQDFILAAHEMLNSKWAEEVGKRAFDLANAMETGKYDV